MGLVERLAAVLGAKDLEELVGGHQSRVFRFTGDDGLPAVAKVLDASTVNRGELEARVALAAALHDLDPRVCRPLPIDDRLVTELRSAEQHHLVVCYERATGTQPDPASADDARLMGTALAELHRRMRQLGTTSLPLVNALRSAPNSPQAEAGPHQLLHGDFNASNLRRTGGFVRIFDLDDCGYGPVAFDVANALYMVLFDATVGGAMDTYVTFRRSFVAGYVAALGAPLEEDCLDRFIDLRVRVLRRWLDDIDNAPVGVRTASSAWLLTLRSFVDGYQLPGGRFRTDL